MPCKDKEERKRKVNEYYQANKEKIKAYQKQYRAKNKEKLALQKQEYYRTNKENIDKYKKEYALKNANKIKKYKKKYSQKHYQENKEAYKLQSKQWCMENPLKKQKRRRTNHLMATYGLSIEDYNDLYDQQKGCCAICGKHQLELSKILFVDHDHKTKAVRGLLCFSCNSGLGFYENHKKNILNYLKGKFHESCSLE